MQKETKQQTDLGNEKLILGSGQTDNQSFAQPYSKGLSLTDCEREALGMRLSFAQLDLPPITNERKQQLFC